MDLVIQQEISLFLRWITNWTVQYIHDHQRWLCKKVGISKIQENEGSWAGLWAEVCMWVDPYNRCNFWGPFLFNYPSLLVKFDLHTRSCMVGIENKVWAGTCGGGQTPTQGLCPGIPGSDYSEVAMTHSQDANSWGELAIARKNFLEEI